MKKSTWKGAAGLAADVRYYGEWMRERAFERIGHLYPKHKGETVIAWLWARTVISPNPAVNAPVPLVRSFALSKKKGREHWAKPIVEGKTVRFEVRKGLPPADNDGTVGKRKFGGARCIISGEPITFAYIRAEGQAGRMGAQMLAIVTQGKRGRNYYSPDREQEQVAAKAATMDYWKPSGKMPLKHRNFQPPLYGMYEYGDLFTERQLVALTAFSDFLAVVRDKVIQDTLQAGLVDDNVLLRDGGTGAQAYSEAIILCLAFAVDKGADKWASLCGWDLTRENMRNVFARQALPMVWDYAEGNPFSGSTGNWSSHLNWVYKVMERLPSRRLGFANQMNAVHINKTGIILSTDPPYYDNISYADISDFFYVWLRRNLRDVYPDVFATMLVPKAAEMIASPNRHGGKDKAKAFFESGMLDTFTNIRRFVRSDYPLTVYYAFKQQDAGFLKAGAKGEVASTGWETMLESLIHSCFSIEGTWPMRTEYKVRANARQASVLASSIILVCRPRPTDAPALSLRRFRDALKAELPAAINELRTGEILPVDLAQASIGPGMAIYSRYRQVLEADGTTVSVRDALALINAALAEALHEFVGDVDDYTRFAVDWFQQHEFEAGDAGTAETLALAKNTSLIGLERAGLIELGGGKVRLLHWSDYDPGAYDPREDERPTVWEGTHHGEVAAAGLLNKMDGYLAGAAQDLAFSLYDICERKGWAGHARDYNSLIASWQGSDGIASVAAQLRGQPEQGDLI